MISFSDLGVLVLAKVVRADRPREDDRHDDEGREDDLLNDRIH